LGAAVNVTLPVPVCVGFDVTVMKVPVVVTVHEQVAAAVTVRLVAPPDALTVTAVLEGTGAAQAGGWFAVGAVGDPPPHAGRTINVSRATPSTRRINQPPEGSEK
jgi:hypothetical protein